MRLPTATDLKTRTGAPTGKDARLVNSYVEVKGEQSVVRKRAIAQGGVSVGSGTAQGMIGFSIAGVDKLIGVWGDTLTNYTGGGTTWNSGTSYLIGDHVSYGFVDYWAAADNSNSNPSSNPSNWSTSYVPSVPFSGTYATWNPSDKTSGAVLSGSNLIATLPEAGGSENAARANIGKTSGKWYWEITATWGGGVVSGYVGISNANSINSVTFTSASVFARSFSAYQDPYTIELVTYGGTLVGKFASDIANGDVLCFAMDADANTLMVRVNNGEFLTILSANMPTGAKYPFCAFNSGATSHEIAYTANFGASAFAYSVPSGYNSGLYTP